MDIIFNSQNSEFKSPFGCALENQCINITIKIKRRLAAVKVLLCLEKDDTCADAHTERASFIDFYDLEWIGLENGYDLYNTNFSISETGLYFYNFKVLTYDYWQYISNDISTNAPYLSTILGNKWQITCYNNEKFLQSHDFWGKTMYQIFPDRFFRGKDVDLTSKLAPFWVHENTNDIPHYLPNHDGYILNNDFYGGNLDGICQKLDYLQDLGVGIIYLNPIFMAFSNHRYDTADYKTIDPMLGSENDFIKLTHNAHDRGMKIILDGVFSHTGADSIYFDKYNHFGGGAYADQNSPYKGWYTFLEYPNKYLCWWDILILPAVNETNADYMDYILYSNDSVVKKWLDLGADGFRLDVADELPDLFLQEFYKTVKDYKPNAFVLGEVWEDASNKISYGNRRKYLQGEQMDSVMNYVFKDAIIEFITGKIPAFDFEKKVMSIVENYPIEVLHGLMNPLSTHDTARIFTIFGAQNQDMSKDEKSTYKMNDYENSLSKIRLNQALFLQFTLPGMPSIYYGDEIGMEGFADPFNRGYMKWDCVDEEIFSVTKALSKLRQNYPCLQYGNIVDTISLDGIFAFVREYDGQKLLCAINLGDKQVIEYFGENIIYNYNYCKFDTENKCTILPNGGCLVAFAES